MIKDKDRNEMIDGRPGRKDRSECNGFDTSVKKCHSTQRLETVIPSPRKHRKNWFKAYRMFASLGFMKPLSKKKDVIHEEHSSSGKAKHGSSRSDIVP